MRKRRPPLLQIGYKWLEGAMRSGPGQGLEDWLNGPMARGSHQATTLNRLSARLAALRLLARSRHLAGLVPKRCLNIALNKLVD